MRKELIWLVVLTAAVCVLTAIGCSLVTPNFVLRGLADTATARAALFEQQRPKLEAAVEASFHEDEARPLRLWLAEHERGLKGHAEALKKLVGDKP